MPRAGSNVSAVASVELHSSVLDCPLSMLVGVAVKLTVGAGVTLAGGGGGGGGSFFLQPAPTNRTNKRRKLRAGGYLRLILFFPPCDLDGLNAIP